MCCAAPSCAQPLLDALQDVDRLVLLGDVLELRHGPPRDAMAAARPFFEDLGRALAGRELIVVAGNHDHALIEPWLARRGQEDEPAPLAVEQLLEPAEVSPMLVRIAELGVPGARPAWPTPVCGCARTCTRRTATIWTAI